MLEHWRMFAAYNAWANRRLYDACGARPEADFSRDGGAFFGSLKATLNHLLVADRIWLARFEGEANPAYRLDTVLFEDLAALTAAREFEDARLSDYVGRLGPDDLGGVVTYRRQATSEDIRQPLAQALAHIFNHQTHHRGQAHALLTQFGGVEAAPSLDLAFFLRGVR
ncbi:putative damage-inducible protein DinB [Methylopila capsulata]|uniref:Damage-inducible protein DinB n=1 Tax=Methylopila capsulata TaxID=61654 RepID=A0A9W6IRG2_9HYPH|nr:DinB family protein [Methylopila capsulata]MBM7849867.1 putative damage-inducible protein DinB [Methylopila capsulata]GLK55157.1 damage-inducible protein DinB [Methylopila capsulata]